jgi:hypothetical protein
MIGSRLSCLALAQICAFSAAAAPPKLNSLFPAGAERGTTVSVNAAGTFGQWPVQAWVDRPGLEITATAEKNTLSVTVAPDAAPGIYWLRLYDKEGATSPRPFIVGTMTEVTENEPNDDRLKPQSIASQPIVVNGRLNKSNDVDSFAVPLYQGQTLVASVEANRILGSPMDSVLQIVSPDGFVLGENDDYHDIDAQLVLVVPADGIYVVRIFGFPATPTASISFAGGEDFVYRLTITTGPFIEYAYPLAVGVVSAGESQDSPGGLTMSHVELHGWNIPGELQNFPLQVGTPDRFFDLSPVATAGRATIRFERHETTTEQEPNGRESPQEIRLPVTLTGRIEKRGDVDVFRFQAKKGERLVFRAESRELGFPLDPLLRVTDAAGKTVTEVDDNGNSRDAELTFTPPADGEFRLMIRDLNGQGGDRYVYRLSAAPLQPSYSLKVAADSFVLAPGKSLEITVTVERANEFAGEIELNAEGLPDGISASAAKSAGTGDTSKAVKMTLTGGTSPLAGPFRIVGHVPGQPLLDRNALAALANLNTSTSDLWITVSP